VTVNAIPSTTRTFSTGDIAVAIADNATVEVPLNVGPAGTVLDVDAFVRLNHTFDGDLDLFLIGPGSAPTVELSTDNGGTGDNYGSGANDCSATHTRFNDAAATPITSGIAPFAGTFRPEGELADFNGGAQSGQWMLRITDDAADDAGTVGCFKLRIRRPT
jgi:subtilisin-like proprotein convertase family protein